MTRTDEEFADKIIYLKENHFMPNIDGESVEVQNAIQSFYFCEKTVTPEGDICHDDPFWFRLIFCDYQVSDDFVKEVNREYKRYMIKNIGVKEFDN